MARRRSGLIEAGVAVGLTGSVILHLSGGSLALFADALFPKTPPPAVMIFEAGTLTEEEFAAIRGEKSPAPEPEPEPEPPAEEEAAAPPEPQPSAPYESAPQAPAQPQLAAETQRDTTPEAEIREALPQPTVAAPSEQLAAPEQTDAAPTISRSSDEPPAENDPCEALARAEDEEGGPQPVSAADPCPEPKDPAEANEAPDQPEFENQDLSPTRSQPDLEREGGEEVPVDAPQEVAEPEPEAAPPEPEDEIAAAAPDSAPRPSRRPRPPEPIAQAEPEPEPEPEPAPAPADPLAGLEGAVAEGTQAFQPTAAPSASPTQERATGQPLSTSEKSAFRFALLSCWQRPPPSVDLAELVITLAVDLSTDGFLLGEPRLLRPTGPLSPAQNAAYRNAVSALKACAPYQSLPRDKYAQWRALAVTFDPATDAPTIE